MREDCIPCISSSPLRPVLRQRPPSLISSVVLFLSDFFSFELYNNCCPPASCLTTCRLSSTDFGAERQTAWRITFFCLFTCSTYWWEPRVLGGNLIPKPGILFLLCGMYPGKVRYVQQYSSSPTRHFHLRVMKSIGCQVTIQICPMNEWQYQVQMSDVRITIVLKWGYQAVYMHK